MRYKRELLPTVKFYLFMIGPGEGCDYTIGCNSRFVPLKAETLEEAQRETMEQLDYCGGLHLDGDGPSVANAYIVEAAKVTDVGIPNLIHEKRMQREREKASKKEDAERAEFERLKAKFKQ